MKWKLEYICTTVVYFPFHRLHRFVISFVLCVCVCAVCFEWVFQITDCVRESVCDIVKESRDGREAVPVIGAAPPRPGAHLLQLVWRWGWHEPSSQTLQRDAQPYRLRAGPQVHLQQPQSPQETHWAAQERYDLNPVKYTLYLSMKTGFLFTNQVLCHEYFNSVRALIYSM